MRIIQAYNEEKMHLRSNLAHIGGKEPKLCCAT